MLSRIMKHEWRMLWADATAWLVILSFAVAIIYGCYNGSRWVAFQRQTILNLQNEETTRLNSLRDEVKAMEIKNAQGGAPATQGEGFRANQPYYIGSFKGLRYAVLPPAPLASVAVGQSDLYPYYFKVSTNLKQDFVNAYELENPIKLLVGRFDLAFVILYLYPLLILALSFNLVAAERESGTLGMLLAQPVKFRSIVIGKAAVRAGLAFFSVMIFALLGLFLSGVSLAAPGAPARLGLWVLAVLIYGAFWFALAIAVNARGMSAATNALVLAACWLVFVVIVPNVVNVLATTLYPVPSRVEYIQTMRESTADEAELRGKLMAAFYEDHPELMRAGRGNLSRLEEFAVTKEMLTGRMEERLRPLMNRFDAQLAGQQNFVDRFRFFSPAILMQQILYDVAGTGASRYKHFMSGVDDFHQEWRGFFNPLIARRQLLASADFDRFPHYAYQEESIGDTVRRVTVPLLSILLPTLLISLFSLHAYRRYYMLR